MSWSSWAEWRFACDAVFSPYPDPGAALRRVGILFLEAPKNYQVSGEQSLTVSLVQIAAWRSRGCLPIPVEVTAALFEIRLWDPFFRYVVWMHSSNLFLLCVD